MEKEEQEQSKVVALLNKMNIRHAAVPNGGSRHFLEAVKLKRSGVSPGFPDLIIPVPNDKHHGLFIEMKRKKGGKVSIYQQDWIDFLNEKGYKAAICNGFDEAYSLIKEYFSQ